MKKKNHTLLYTVLIIIVFGVLVGVSTNGKRPVNTINNTESKNEIENTTKGQNKEETKNNVAENTAVENKTVENKVEENTKGSETFTESPKTAEEKAINIVKKDYGDKKNTEYSVEGIDEKGRQIVVVRNATTTEAYAFYFVDVDNNTFVKQ